MRILLALCLLTFGALGTSRTQDLTQPAEALEQHRWLQQLVGDWKVSSEAILEPGAEPMLWESREHVRSIGGLWVLVEASAELAGEPFTSLLTLGYDPDQGTFVGSWVDTMQTRMWTYVGQLGEAQRILTLETEGPSFFDPDKTASYRDQLELIGPDEKRMTSTVLTEDGTWMVYLTVRSQRVK